MMKSSTMERLGGVSTDSLQQQLMANHELISGVLADQLSLIEELNSRQVHTADGCRTMGEWVSRILDTTMNDARDLVRTMRRTVDRPHLREALASGVSFRRVEALSKIPEDLGLLEEQDVASVFRLAARKARLTAADEVRTLDDRFLVLQPTLDRSWYKIWGGVDGYAGEIIENTLTRKADQVQVPEGHGYLGTGWRMATALVDLC